jgi:putative transposase
MPWALHRYQQTGALHFLTFSCYHRLPKLGTPASRDRFEHSLESTRAKYAFHVFGYVVMPEHIHLLVSEPQHNSLAKAIQTLKHSVSLHLGTGEPFWQSRYYDFNVFSERKRIEKLRYIHRNPVARGLVTSPDRWQWSSFRQYASLAHGGVKVSLPRLTPPSQIQNPLATAAPE